MNAPTNQSAERLFSLPSGGIMGLAKASLREGGGTRSVTEGAYGCTCASLGVWALPDVPL